MDEVRLGDRVLFQHRVCIVRGVTPASVTPPLVHLVDRETGTEADARLDEVEPVEDSVSVRP